MANQLRPIALTVDEPSPGLFHWALLESSGERGVYDRDVEVADEPYDSFDKAARAGLLRWTLLASDDVRRGPRTPDEREPLEPPPGPWSRNAATSAA